MKSYYEFNYGEELFGGIKKAFNTAKTVYQVGKFAHNANKALQNGDVSKGLDVLNKVADIAHHAFVGKSAEAEAKAAAKAAAQKAADKWKVRTALGVGGTAAALGGTAYLSHQMLSDKDDH